MNSGSRCFGARDDLIGCQMLIGGIEDFNHGLARSGHPFMSTAEQAQGCLDSGRRR
jgi:hypothetical protein